MRNAPRFVGAWTLAFVGVGLTLPVWLEIWRPV